MPKPLGSRSLPKFHVELPHYASHLLSTMVSGFFTPYFPSQICLVFLARRLLKSLTGLHSLYRSSLQLVMLTMSMTPHVILGSLRVLVTPVIWRLCTIYMTSIIFLRSQGGQLNYMIGGSLTSDIFFIGPTKTKRERGLLSFLFRLRPRFLSVTKFNLDKPTDNVSASSQKTGR